MDLELPLRSEIKWPELIMQQVYGNFYTKDSRRSTPEYPQIPAY